MEKRVAIGSPRVRDGADIHRLVAACEPLDLNSTYAYLLLCEHFPETCVRAEDHGRTVGFVSAYRPPKREDVIFVWQVAVAAELRGQGLARRMLRELLARPAVAGCRYMETTVSPSNGPSLRLFHRLARELGAPLAQQALFHEEDFGSERHESETLIRIGPFGHHQRQGETRT
ncbi:MAG TPA: diaminobutyrate acetyltransferase [Burkholderiales bacterium]|nr:diaminobutyrate acetyltransferase [Burkholderiales bacterium]